MTISEEMRGQLADVLADENGLRPTAAAMDVLATVITALQDTDLTWALNSMPATPQARVYAASVMGDLANMIADGPRR
ncbi:hypothetical protein ORI20_13980 [Mycobacterium sp. CVI_P3]|uniref:Uncharacterized protein n=1 Tax=Mycobacterium pinniadriaticum TaxID=2994102 RepID=A0ABT3SFA4_9MYCO|nr:hypothetical protein [Mycobacterium pinniadriaticum]MCX2931389.1 hypothetical protein [Mycobacterium pinniadriaticum]MCX2937813.1 hypothetical protein [Mycobacterium pinniadriaticum]